MLIITSALSLALITRSTLALPAAIRDTPTNEGNDTIGTLMETALGKLLASQEASPGNFFIPGGRQTVTFAGANGSDDDDSKNNAIFADFDEVATNNLFSDNYKTFIEDVAKALSIDPNATESNPQLQSASDSQVQACFPDLQKVKTAALSAYIQSTGALANGTSDPAFQSWAEDQYTPYTEAETKCQAAENNYNALYAKIHGDNFAVFSQAITNMQPLIRPDSAAHPGIMMEISNGTGSGRYLPAYSIPPLEGTLDAWQGGSGLAPFTYSSTNDKGSDNSTSKSGGASFSFQWKAVSASAGGDGSTTTDATSYSAQDMEVSFGSATLIGIERGIWFDDFRSADALKSASASSDNITAAAIPVFKTHFGSAGASGPAAVYNAQALVAYQPKIGITFASSDTYQKFQSVSAGGGLCLGPFCFGGHGASSSNTSTWDNSTNTFTYDDQTSNGYILGYIQTSFWGGSTIQNSTNQ